MSLRVSSWRWVCGALIALVLLANCSSATMIMSDPSGARVYIDGQYLGDTPVRYSDTKISGTSISVALEKEGYQKLNTVINRNEDLHVGALIGGLFFLIPFLWIVEYEDTHSYRLTPELSGNQAYQAAPEYYDNQAYQPAPEYYDNQAYQPAPEYYDNQAYQLPPAHGVGNYEVVEEQNVITPRNTQALRDLKALYDEGILTRKEYETQKAKIISP